MYLGLSMTVIDHHEKYKQGKQLFHDLKIQKIHCFNPNIFFNGADE